MTAPMQSEGPPGKGVPMTPERAYTRALKVGIGASAVLHIVLVLLYSVVITQWSPRETLLGVESPALASGDMRVVQVIEIESPDPTAEAPEEPPEPVAELQVEVPDVGPPLPDDIDLDEPPRGLRAADVLRVRSADARLWRQALPEAFELTEVERMELALAGRLEEWADSVAEAVAAEYALTDWTRTDDQGRRWGFSPGMIHLGDITLPMPFNFGGTAMQREQLARRAWEDQDILLGTSGQALRSSWRERAEAIRRRRDRDRDRDERSAASDTTGTSGG